MEKEKAKDKKADNTIGPNEKKANAYLEACQNSPLLNEEERILIVKAKEALRQGRFQNLQRDINKFQQMVKKSALNSAIVLEKLMTILKGYPLVNVQEEEAFEKKVVVFKALNPKIIITESFN